MTKLLGRFTRQQQRIEDDRKITRILVESGADTIEPSTPTAATAAGDERKLRGIPAIARGVQGAIPGTRP